MNKKTIGDPGQIIAAKQEAFDCEGYINEISTKTQQQLETWVNNKFSQLNPDSLQAMQMIIKAVWALTRTRSK